MGLGCPQDFPHPSASIRGRADKLMGEIGVSMSCLKPKLAGPHACQWKAPIRIRLGLEAKARWHSNGRSAFRGPDDGSPEPEACFIHHPARKRCGCVSKHPIDLLKNLTWGELQCLSLAGGAVLRKRAAAGTRIRKRPMDSNQNSVPPTSRLNLNAFE